jgi:hypothetical protein
MGLGLWCLAPPPTIDRGSQFHWLRKPENPEKTTDLSQVTDKLYKIEQETFQFKTFNKLFYCFRK